MTDCPHDFKPSEVTAPGYCPHCDGYVEDLVAPHRKMLEVLLREYEREGPRAAAEGIRAALAGNVAELAEIFRVPALRAEAQRRFPRKMAVKLRAWMAKQGGQWRDDCPPPEGFGQGWLFAVSVCERAAAMADADGYDFDSGSEQRIPVGYFLAAYAERLDFTQGVIRESNLERVAGQLMVEPTFRKLVGDEAVERLLAECLPGSTSSDARDGSLH